MEYHSRPPERGAVGLNMLYEVEPDAECLAVLVVFMGNLIEIGKITDRDRKNPTFPAILGQMFLLNPLTTTYTSTSTTS
jgi:hypothetical protein